MLDIKFIRENKELIKLAAKKKHLNFDVDKLLEVDDKRLSMLSEVEKMRADQNKTSANVGLEKDSSKRERLISEMKELKDGLSAKEDRLKTILSEWRMLMLEVPNIPDFSVPEGNADTDNQEIRTWGEKPIFNFAPKSHVELMQKLDLVEFEQGTKVTGFRGYFLKNEAVSLCMSIWQLTLLCLARKGFTPMIAPSLVKKESFMGTGYLPQFEDDLYKTQDDLYLSGTGEVPTMGYYMNTVLEENELPKKFLTFSPCFRREAGSHGKDTKGLIRVHEFFKWEQIILCQANHETSVKYHEELTANAEEIVKLLGLPYRVVVNCGGDLGLGQVKKYDIETWVPSENKYRETHSSSYFHDFQTRRLNIKYKDKNGKLHFAHSLNNTAIATPRILASLLECYQNADGSANVPLNLKKYLGKDIIKR